MGNLSQFQPTTSKTVEAIYAYHKQAGDAESPRRYLGASIIGHECDRYLWFSFRQCFAPSFDGRMYRLFETGDLAESRFVTELRKIGCKVFDRDERGEQFAVSALGGHLAGHQDAVATGIPEAPKTPHVCEFKTHNDKSFTALVKVGVKAHKPMHYAQMMVYMGLGDLTRALYLAVNKDSDELYSERIEFNAGEFKAILVRAERIIRSVMPPERCASRPDDWRCKFCDASEICWGTGSVAVPIPRKTCRTCCHATPEIDQGETWARWSCAKNKRDITPGEQDEACPSHLLIPGLILFADPCDSGGTWIEFGNHKDGAHWRHGDGAEGSWTTEELMKTPGPLVGAKPVQDVKAIFGGTVERTDTLPLIDRYPHEDSRLRCEGPIESYEDFFTGEWGKHVEGLDETERFEDETHLAVEYGRRFLLVYYKTENYAALWEGVE